jgi:hypothetical protein
MSLKFGSSSVSKTVRESTPDGPMENLCATGASGVAAGGLGSKPRPSGASLCSCANVAVEANAATPAAMTKSLCMEFPWQRLGGKYLSHRFFAAHFISASCVNFRKRSNCRATALSAGPVCEVTADTCFSACLPRYELAAGSRTRWFARSLSRHRRGAALQPTPFRRGPLSRACRPFI